MDISKQERHAAEVSVHQLGHEQGIQAMRKLLFLRRDEINTSWPDAIGDALIKLQGEAKLVRKLINTIDHGPAVKTLAQE